MKKVTVMLAAVLAATVTFGQANGAKQESLATARAKITQVIEKPEEMSSVMGALSSQDQVKYLSDVLTAISSMPADDAARTEKFVAVVNAALASSQKGNALELVAEVYAKVPPYALAAVSESLAAGLMNRATLPKTVTNAVYVSIATKVMARVNERVASEDNSGVRSAFAAVMLIRASNSESPDVVSAIADALPDSVQADAKSEWLPSALGQGRDKSYEPMMAAVDGDLKPAYGVSPDSSTGGPQSATAGGPQAASAEGPQSATAGGPQAASAEGPQAASAEGPQSASAGGPQSASAGGPQSASAGGPQAASAEGPQAAASSEPLVSLRVPVVQSLDGLLADIGGAATDPRVASDGSNPMVDSVNDPFNVTLPLGTGEASGSDGVATIVTQVEESSGYQNQTTQD